MFKQLDFSARLAEVTLGFGQTPGRPSRIVPRHQQVVLQGFDLLLVATACRPQQIELALERGRRPGSRQAAVVLRFVIRHGQKLLHQPARVLARPCLPCGRDAGHQPDNAAHRRRTAGDCYLDPGTSEATVLPNSTSVSMSRTPAAQ